MHRTVFRESGMVGGDRFWEFKGDSHNKVQAERGARIHPLGLKQGSQLFGGDFGYFDTTNGADKGTFKALQAWKVTAVNGTTSFRLYKDDFTHDLKVLGDVILAIAPSLTAGTKTAATVTGVQFTAANITEGDDYYELTGTITGIAVGSIIVMADATGAGANVLVPNVNAVLSEPIYFERTPTLDYVADKGYKEIRHNVYYKIGILQAAKVIPPYVLQLNTYINNTHVFSL